MHTATQASLKALLRLEPAADVALCAQQTGLDALKSQSGISVSLFLFPVRPSEGQHSSGTPGYLAEESEACGDALEMGLESQQEWFKRLTLVSNSMGPVSGILQDGFLDAAGRVYRVCACRLPAEMLIHTSLQFSHRRTYVCTCPSEISPRSSHIK